MGERQCPGCGRYLGEHVEQCPFCRETLPPLPKVDPYRVPQGGEEIRRGLLYMLLAGVLYYFAAGYSPYQIPYPYSHWLTDLGLPLLFLAGFGLVTYGFYRRAAG